MPATINEKVEKQQQQLLLPVKQLAKQKKARQTKECNDFEKMLEDLDLEFVKQDGRDVDIASEIERDFRILIFRELPGDLRKCKHHLSLLHL